MSASRDVRSLPDRTEFAIGIALSLTALGLLFTGMTLKELCLCLWEAPAWLSPFLLAALGVAVQIVRVPFLWLSRMKGDVRLPSLPTGIEE